jgi:hypothetical protein
LCATFKSGLEAGQKPLNIIAKFDKAGEKLTRGAGASIVSELSQVLTSLLGNPYRATSAIVTDLKKNRVEVVGSILHTPGSSTSSSNPVEIEAENTACVIEVSDCLDLERFRASYARVASIKGLTKKAHTPSPDGTQTNGTLICSFSWISSSLLQSLSGSCPLVGCGAKVSVANRVEQPTRGQAVTSGIGLPPQPNRAFRFSFCFPCSGKVLKLASLRKRRRWRA